MYVLSFDIEEHYRIEAAANIECSPERKPDYANRMERSTRAILERLAAANAKATFYVVGQIAETHPQLVRDIASAGHEIGTHSYDHQRVHRFTQQRLSKHRTDGCPAIATARKRCAPRALQGDVTPVPGLINHLAEQQRAAVTQPRREVPELMPGIDLCQRLGTFRQPVA